MVNNSQYDPKKPGHLHAALISMPEFILRQQIESINTSIYIFDQNFVELKTLLEFIINDPKSFPLTFQENRDKQHKVQLETLRLLHNFVAASLTLIDHTRNYYKELYGDTDKFPDYQLKKAEFEKDPLSQFVKCLRIYCQHYYSPNILVQESFFQNPDGSQAMGRKVLLSKDDLITFDGWSPIAKKYLNKHDKNIDVLEVTETYRTKVIDFYRWFINRQKEIHKDELSHVAQKENEFIQAYIEYLIDSRLKQEKPDTTIEEEVFAGIINSDEFVELESFKAPPKIKADLAIMLLSRHYPIPESLRMKIIHLYQQEQITHPV